MPFSKKNHACSGKERRHPLRKEMKNTLQTHYLTCLNREVAWKQSKLSMDCKHHI